MVDDSRVTVIVLQLRSSVLYIQPSLDSEAAVFLDPNTLSVDGTTSISVASFSEDGRWFAYGLSDAGSDWVRIKIRNVDSGRDCEEEIRRCKFTSISWTHDHLGFFYAVSLSVGICWTDFLLIFFLIFY